MLSLNNNNKKLTNKYLSEVKKIGRFFHTKNLTDNTEEEEEKHKKLTSAKSSDN